MKTLGEILTMHPDTMAHVLSSDSYREDGTPVCEPAKGKAGLPDALAAVLALAEKATTGPWSDTWTGRSGSGFVKLENRHYSISGVSPEIPGFMNARPQDVARLAGESAHKDSDNAALIAAAVNLIRDHGPALLTLATADGGEGRDAAMFDDWPEFHAEGMGCGLEDRGITDRYEAMRYGWDEAIDAVFQRMNAALTPEKSP
jgi:hypothetical protein